MSRRQCPGPSLSAMVTIRQSIVGSVRPEHGSIVDVDVDYSAYQQDGVRQSYSTTIDLSPSQSLRREGFTLTFARRPN
jgi:hypothetical protein